jgi:hypothetical protein
VPLYHPSKNDALQGEVEVMVQLLTVGHDRYFSPHHVFPLNQVARVYNVEGDVAGII